ncbi:hypothetical protein [Streptomyces sp. STCH 565 A]|uniref:hypothetical protein n=1 Tax=Streptomyces sp. STCH 565 A TaxID=2950532 RepID=UPI002075D1DF|nr:hypothetical protein [Streptomyces sp. STCH 565 A]MCM8555971.1 hypothetical protein [Streptomyces sp. STCH 565 A]
MNTKLRMITAVTVALGAVMATAGSAQADPGRPNNPISGSLPNTGDTLVQYSTYRTVSSWEQVQFRYENTISHSLRMGLRDTSGWQFSPTKIMGSKGTTYTIAQNGSTVSIPQGKRFAINARSNGFMWNYQDHNWGGHLYW